MKSLYASVFILIYLIVKSSGLPVRQRSQELFMTEVIRVRRQAGYVYNKPSVSFDLPSRALSSTVTTQAPTVDRTQAQMMYYAYPVPATSSNVGASGGPTVDVGGGSTAPGSTGISSGYNYGAQNALSTGPQSVSTSGTSQTGFGSSSASSSGYGYNAPLSNGSTQKSTNTESSGYGYSGPSAGVAQVPNIVKPVQTDNVGSSQIGSVAGAGYEYNIPSNTQSSGVAATIDVSTNAPKYLPPPSGGGNSNDITSSSVLTGDKSSSIVSGTSVTRPLDQYLPPLISKSDSPATTVVDQYLPPIRQSESSASASRTPVINKEIHSDSVPRPNSSYIPPNLGLSPLLLPNFTPRPFSSASLTDGYLPPIPNSQVSAPNSQSTPASPYLPPVF